MFYNYKLYKITKNLTKNDRRIVIKPFFKQSQQNTIPLVTIGYQTNQIPNCIAGLDIQRHNKR